MTWKISSFEQYQKAYRESVENPEAFWDKVAQNFVWRKKWDKVFEGGFENVDMKWFIGGRLNITENCLDRHLKDRGNQTALIFEPNDPQESSRLFTFLELHQAVCKTANILKDLGVRKGDRVCLYMGMVPELLISVLACARLGAIHSVVFGGFSAHSLAERINDAQCSLLITNNGAYRGDKIIPLKAIADEALVHTPSIEKVLVHQRITEKTGVSVENFKTPMQEGRDLWWHDLFSKASPLCDATEVDAEDPLFILYTSGSTGKPKGVLHTTGGYMVWAAYTFENVFQFNQKVSELNQGIKADIHWCTADIGWVTGHTYLTYGPLLSGVTTVLFEGTPTWPDSSRFWQVIDKHQVTHFYTAPTAIRALEAQSLDYVEKCRLNSLKVLGSVGEPINEEAWEWYYRHIGKEKCPIVDTWWQTETGGIMISPLAGITKTKPCYATLPLPGVLPVIVDKEGNILEGNNVEGNLCLCFPWPGAARSLYKDHERFKETYFKTYPGLYFTGDGCKRDSDGFYRITGRVDDVLNVSGHRLGTAEIENVLNLHENVVESAVVGFPHKIKGTGIYAYVICNKRSQDPKENEVFRKEVTELVSKYIGPIAKPDKIQMVTNLPKTRSGKIMRRILRKIAEGDFKNLGDTSTLLDPGVVKEIQEGVLL